LITLVWPAGCFHSTSSPIHFLWPGSPPPAPYPPHTPIFLSFLLSLFLFSLFQPVVRLVDVP